MPLFFGMGRVLTINVDMIIVQGVKRYRNDTIDADFLPPGHTEILLAKGSLLDPNNMTVAEVSKTTLKNFDEIKVPELKEYLTLKQIKWPSGADKKTLYELYKNNA